MAKDPLSSEIHFWRLDPAEYAATWNSGVGAEKVGGRWNPKGMGTVYAALDASTAILEVAVHKDFDALDSKPHCLTQARVLDRSGIHVVQPDSIANPNWLVPGTPSRSQQKFGADLLSKHPFVLVPSSVSPHSWNLLMNPHLADGLYELVLQEPFALDGRLNRPLP
ncbi:RES domain-containing protein [Pseudomonas sp. SJZ085]|uniref:RES family NAD+ phosphorylase n=1 Tax=unclassified Pseudomonas TaxID=196821 RepID=UPI00119A0345|nr:MULTISPECIES: RES domain-containing protein [unclassified Pseudomonas]TWC18623.1 RES domain-containing protein [Pseudomonas sp. SJZ074]TWC36406.1 RES domain-containing protein [Pseudomonas sp. SJZ085]